MTLRLDVQGNTLTAYLNGAMKGTFTATDSAQILPMGGIGLMVQRANVEFDDVIVRAAVAASLSSPSPREAGRGLRSGVACVTRYLLARAAATAATSSRARSVITASSPRRSAAMSTSSEPTPSAAAPAAMNSPAVCGVHAAGGQHLHVGQRALAAPCRYFGAAHRRAGKIFTMSAPAFHAVITSVGVSAPGITGTPRPCAAAMVPRSRPGLTMNAAPASMHGARVVGVQHRARADHGAIARTARPATGSPPARPGPSS